MERLKSHLFMSLYPMTVLPETPHSGQVDDFWRSHMIFNKEHLLLGEGG